MLSRLKPLCLLFMLSCTFACGDNTEADLKTSTAEVAEQSVEVVEEAASLIATDIEPEAPLISDARIKANSILNRTWTGDLDVMEQQRVIRILTVYSPGRYYLDGPEEKGLVYEMFKRFEDSVNKSLNRGHLKVHVVFIPVARDQLIPALLEGRGDIIAAGLTITPERSEQVAFSKPVSKPVQEILVTGPAASAIDTIDDLAGKTLFVRTSSSYRESIEALNTRFAAEGNALVNIEALPELLEDDDLIEMVNTGLLPWAVVDAYKTQLWDGVFTELVVRNDIVFRSAARLGYAFRKGSPKLEAQLNTFLKTHKQGTLMGNILVNRYLRDFDWAANALQGDEFQRFKDLEHIFQAYGEQYGIDYLIVAAQGYQESRLNQDVRSHAGAVGIMQLLPTTAADKNVGIPNIEEIDPNIHAGVKYLQYLRNRYFSDPEISDTNATLLALAAYNAGPARLINLRNEAEKLGYDRNVWFDNVEIVAAKRIGRETVQYVSNIYKYYLSYLLAMQHDEQHQAARKKAGIK